MASATLATCVMGTRSIRTLLPEVSYSNRSGHGWRTLQTAGFTKHKIPQLTGFMYSPDRPQLRQGLLYEWTEPSKVNPTLSQVNIHRVPIL